MVHIDIDHKIKPVNQPLRRVPLAYEKQIEKEIMSLLESDIIEEVKHYSAWQSAIVPIQKSKDEIRICVDMRAANKAILKLQHQMPTIEKLSADLCGSKIFSKLDLKKGFHQIRIDESSRDITTFKCHKGIFRYKRLMFGLSTAPEQFQKSIEFVLRNITGVFCFVDDILIYGRTKSEHDERVKTVLNRLREYNVLLNEDKCSFGKTELRFLGLKISESGLKPNEEKVNALRNAKEPSNKEELLSFLGLLSYVGSRFLPNLASHTQNLRKLLKKEEKFVWKQEYQENFDTLKKELENLISLSFYDPDQEKELYVDASLNGLGSVLVQVDGKGVRKIVAVGSRSLIQSEKNYSNIEREALAVFWGVKRHSYYLLGNHFKIRTDHKPLIDIFEEKTLMSHRLERWVMGMQNYDYKMIYVPGKEQIADFFSRSNSNECDDYGNDDEICLIVEQQLPKALNMEEFKNLCNEDQEYQQIKVALKNDSWPKDLKR